MPSIALEKIGGCRDLVIVIRGHVMHLIRLYRWYFILHIPITLLVDLVPFYPDSEFFRIPNAIFHFYCRNFHDPLLSDHSLHAGWFRSFLFLEGLLQLPICCYLAMQRTDYGKVSRSLILTYAVQVFTTTFGCIAELSATEHISATNRWILYGFYLPYLVIAVIMAVDVGASTLREASTECDELRYLSAAIAHQETEPRVLTILITGTNSGLGFGIVRLLIDTLSFALKHKQVTLKLVLTVRNEEKATSTAHRLSKYKSQYGKSLGIEFLLLDLASLDSTESCCREILRRYDRIDVAIFNAGMGDFCGLDWLGLVRQFLVDPKGCFTAPTYKLQRVGSKTRDGLGLAFQTNFFGHYYMQERLRHVLMTDSRVIWVSSLEAHPTALDFSDPQGLHSTSSYESSKRLIDVIHRTMEQDGNDLYAKQYLTHPGLCTTSIFAQWLNPTLNSIYAAVFYIARLCGSKWHVCSPYLAANSIVHCALNKDVNARPKWGSGASRFGQGLIVQTPMEVTSTATCRRLLSEMRELRSQWLDILPDQKTDC